MDIDNKMKKYKHLHKINSVKNKYSNNKKLATFINKNLYKMNNEEKKILISKCLSETEINKILLNFEMKNLDIKSEEMDLKTFQKKAEFYLLRYQHNAGGYLIEDREWIVYNSKSNDYNLDINSIVFENSLFESNLSDKETLEFINDLSILLNKISNNITVNYELLQSKKESLVWIIIKCIKNN